MGFPSRKINIKTTLNVRNLQDPRKDKTKTSAGTPPQVGMPDFFKNECKIEVFSDVQRHFEMEFTPHMPSLKKRYLGMYFTRRKMNQERKYEMYQW
jgi:hypothetical protein